MKKIKILYVIVGWGIFFEATLKGDAISTDTENKIYTQQLRPMNDPNVDLRGKPYKKGLKIKKPPVSEEKMGSEEPSSIEITTVTPTAIGDQRREQQVTVIDNSLLPAFPPIADQGDESSCVAFSTTYYVASHEACLVKNCNNATARENIFSPSWTYNFLNGGSIDEGLSPPDALNLLIKHGAPFIQSFPYNKGSNWDLSHADWTAAMTMRSANNFPLVISDYNSALGIQTIKQYLFEGHLLSIGVAGASLYVRPTSVTFSDGSKQYLVVVVDPPYYMDHEVTLVGYDDSATYINTLTGKQESGLFKVANSWGSAWGNNGFFYIAYSSFLNTQSVNPMDVDFTAYGQMGRPAGYTPSYVAKLTLSASDRFIAGWNFGNNLNQNNWFPSMFCSPLNPELCFSSDALINPDLAYKGSSSGPQDDAAVITPVTFFFDLTDYIAENPSIKELTLNVSNNKYNAQNPVDSYIVKLNAISILNAEGKIISHYGKETTVESPIVIPLTLP